MGEIEIPDMIGTYKVVQVLGSGCSSTVVLVEQDSQHYACKVIPRVNISDNMDDFENEIRIFQLMNHPNIVHLIDLLSDNYNFYVIMEYCPKGELFNHIVKRKYVLEYMAKPMIRIILEAVDYIHELNITHRDIKPENILVDSDGTLKLSDFGLSAHWDEDELVDTACGSSVYASPECLSGEKYSGRTTDVWSCGITFFVMLTGQCPWTSQDENEMFDQIRSGDMKVPEWLSKDCIDFLSSLLRVDPERRMTIQEALKHPWLQIGRSVSLNRQRRLSMQLGMKRVSQLKIDQFFGKNIIPSVPKHKSFVFDEEPELLDMFKVGKNERKLLLGTHIESVENLVLENEKKRRCSSDDESSSSVGGIDSIMSTITKMRTDKATIE